MPADTDELIDPRAPIIEAVVELRFPDVSQMIAKKGTRLS